MDHVKFTELAASALSGEEKRAARLEVYKEGASKGWCSFSEDKTVAWLMRDQSTRIGMISEVSML